MKLILRALQIVIMSLIVLSCKNEAKDIVKPQITDNIDLMLKELHKQGKFNGNLLVVKNGEILYSKSFGYADNTKNIVLTTEYRFGIGSIYKEFPAVAIMQLLEEDKLSIDDPIRTHLPDLPKWAENVTIRNLLQYSSGLPRIDFGKYFSANKSISSEDILADLNSIEKLEFQPGTDYIYSNNNPFLLIQIVEKLSGKKFMDYAREKLFLPYNLKNTVFKEQYPYKNKSTMAFPFSSDFEQDNYKINTQTMLLSSNIDDLYSWIKELHSFNIIRKESLNFLAETAKINNTDMQAPLGNCTIINGQIAEHSHHGSMGNYECLIQHDNIEDLSIIILTNQKNQNVFDISENIKIIVTETD